MVDEPKYSEGDSLWSDMGGDDYAVVKVKDVWSEIEEHPIIEDEEVEVYYYSFEFLNEHSPHEKGTIISKRRAGRFEDAWNPGTPPNK